jgi:hypothetical protein
MEKKHHGKLSAHHTEQVLSSATLFVSNLQCVDCGATVTGEKDFSGTAAWPLEHTDLRTVEPRPQSSMKGRNTKR